MANKTRKISDDHALLLNNLAQRLGRKVDPGQYRNLHDAPDWTEQVEGMLSLLPQWAAEKLVFLLEQGPSERPEA